MQFDARNLTAFPDSPDPGASPDPVAGPGPGPGPKPGSGASPSPSPGPGPVSRPGPKDYRLEIRQRLSAGSSNKHGPRLVYDGSGETLRWPVAI